MNLNEYIVKVLDVNNDGKVTAKDLLDLFPSKAVAIVALFVDVVVAVAEYRVWDVGMKITDGDPIKSIGFVLVSALPFYLGQLAWLYPRATQTQQFVAGGWVLAGIATSANFGLADLSLSYNVNDIVQRVILLTVAYIVTGLFYILKDPTIIANRAKRKVQDNVAFETEIQRMTRSLLAELKQTQEMENETVAQYKDRDAVLAILNQLRGKQNNTVALAKDVPTPELRPVNPPEGRK